MDKVKQRLELALRPAEPPTLEEVLEQVSRHGTLRGPVDWVFPAWMLYVDYATQKAAEAFPLSEEEREQLFQFRDALKSLLGEAWAQAREKLAALYRAVAEGAYRVEGRKLYAPDGTWMYTNRTVTYVLIHGESAEVRFPDLLKLTQERLELFQLGWRASDEGSSSGRPLMNTSQPWQAFAWAAVRYGELYVRVAAVVLTREGASVLLYIKAKSWRQNWSKDKAISLVMEHFRNGEWAPMLAMWLGDGKVDRRRVFRGYFSLMIANKEPWRLGKPKGENVALVAWGREVFAKLKEAAGIYGNLLDLLNSHKWVIIKFITDEAFRVSYKLKTKKRSIDLIRRLYGRRRTSEQLIGGGGATQKNNAVVVAGVEMLLNLVYNQSGTLFAKRYVDKAEKALAIAERLESAGLRPNVIPTGPDYMVYIAMEDLLKLAEKDEAVRRAIARYLAEKAKNGTPKQREAAAKILQRYPFFQDT
jgi:predicted CopG family antitoxin